MAIDDQDLTSLRLPELQELFKRATGQASRSPNRTFLIRRIRETQTAAAKRGPSEPRRVRRMKRAGAMPTAAAASKSERMMVLPVRLNAGVVRRFDAAYKRLGIKSRMEMFRRALAAFLRAAGEREVAALLETDRGS